MGKVTVVGSYIVALVMDTDRIPVEGETVLGRNYHTTHGGKGSNMAACAARLGAEATFMGKIGRDVFGDAFNSGLAVGLSENKPLTEAIAFGVTAASLSTQKRETIESYPFRPQVDERIGEVLKGIV